MQRNVRPRKAQKDDVESDPENNDRKSLTEDSEEDPGSSLGNDGRERHSPASDDSADEEDIEGQVSNVSFGALLKARDVLSRKRERDLGEDETEQLEKRDAVRSRLNDFKRASDVTDNSVVSYHKKSSGREAGSLQFRKGERVPDGGHEENSDSAPSEEEMTSNARSSKHAPMAQSSKYQVTRKRNVVEVPKRVVRDPRFDALRQVPDHPGNSDKAYSFLRDYQKDEIVELKKALKLTRAADDRETLKRKINSMENRIKSKEAEERRQKVVTQYRKEEREKVQQGKKPFYLKEKDIRERALVEKFKGMKSKDREKLVEKRKKREDQKEKKRMPQARRVAR